MAHSPVVFVLDDDESVATGLTRMLRARGYTVHPTTSPLEFLDRLDPTVPGCLVADICMPSMTGLELQDALRAAGLEVADQPVSYAPDTTQGGYLATRELLQAHPQLTAILATNDLPALGALHAAADLGLQVPRDLSVIGITDIQLAQESRPALTTVAVPTVEAAELAVSLLRELIETSPRGIRASSLLTFRCAGESSPTTITRN